MCLFEIAWPTLLYCTTFLVRDLILWTWTPLNIAVYRLQDLDQMWFQSKDHRNYTEKKKYWQKLTFSCKGAELEKGRNLLAETSGGQIRKGPKPLATCISIENISARGLIQASVRADPEEGDLGFGFLVRFVRDGVMCWGLMGRTM